MPMKPSNISLRDVGRTWGDRVALADVNLQVAGGERIALIGPSGSGKTTLLRLLMGGLRTSHGTIEFDGYAIQAMTPSQVRRHRLRCGLVDQGMQVIPRLSVHDNVIAGRVASWPWWKTLASTFIAIDRDDVQALLADVGLQDRQWDHADELSGGQKQRVSIARAMAGKPALILADEPTAALDPTTSAEVIELLIRESTKRNATLIISTHRVSQVIGLMDRVVGLRDARIFFDKPAADITNIDLDDLYAGSSERA